MTKRSPFRYFKTSPEIIRLADPQADRFPADNHTAFGEKVFDICGPQSKPIVGPHGICDHGTWVAEAFEAWERGRYFHFCLLPSTAHASNLAMPLGP